MPTYQSHYITSQHFYVYEKTWTAGNVNGVEEDEKNKKKMRTDLTRSAGHNLMLCYYKAV